MEKFHEDKCFEGVDYSEKKVSYREFNNCEFMNCNFQKADISNNDFMDCIFKGCNLSLAVMNNTGLKNVRFEECKLMGIDFHVCSDFLFSISVHNSQLDYCSFFQKKMKKTNFNNCSLKETDFAETDLTMAQFNNCDLLNASFVRTILEKTDFRTAINYSFDPELNKVKQAKFSVAGIAGLLAKYNVEIE